jgi:hypothetical protein
MNDRSPKTYSWKKRLLATIGIFLGLLIGLFAVLIIALRPAAPIQLKLGDGRILQIEAVTYGITHQIGTDSIAKRLQPWLPTKLFSYLSPDRRANKISLERPGLVVWMNALSEVGLTNVDCQGIRVEIVDRQGDLFGETTRSWFGGDNFWRVGHVFDCYPREEKELHLRITTWRQKQTVSTTIRNPQPGKRESWSGNSLPIIQQAGDFQIQLTGLIVKTNGQGDKTYYETATSYFEPQVSVLSAGAAAAGWESPEWVTESANGNRGQFLGVQHDALRFLVAFYPTATNLIGTKTLATMPEVHLAGMTTNLWWNQTNASGHGSLVILGLFRPGTHTFSEGVYQYSSLTVNGPGGGAPSGWTGNTRQATPFKEIKMLNHYTPTPVIYVRVPEQTPDPFESVKDEASPQSTRLAIRLKDSSGRYWVAEPERESGGIKPFRIVVPNEATTITPELILLQPLKAEFLVNTKNTLAP